MTEFGAQLPEITVPPPGPASRAYAERLRAVESRNVTCLTTDFPVFWTEARGANVRDADGNVYLDLTSAFGVALTGHANPRITSAIAAQADRLVHGMGDVHPPAIKVELLERLAALLPWDDTRTVLASAGSEAVEIALKTALLATGRPGIVAFEGGYHGLTLGALATTGREDFRAPFRSRLREAAFAPFPSAGELGEDAARTSLEAVAGVLRNGDPAGEPVGAIIVEPIQGRGGVRIPPAGFLGELLRLAHDHGALLIVDEIYTGFGRTGSMFAFEHEGVTPDLVCVGKALGGGLPISACAGPAAVMDAWPPSEGEALHTSTFLGHPLACAAALAFLDELERTDVPHVASDLGSALLAALTSELAGSPGVADVRGRGAFIGIELGRGSSVWRGGGAEATVGLLRQGILALPAGTDGEVVELSPTVTMNSAQFDEAVRALGSVIREMS